MRDNVSVQVPGWASFLWKLAVSANRQHSLWDTGGPGDPVFPVDYGGRGGFRSGVPTPTLKGQHKGSNTRRTPGPGWRYMVKHSDRGVIPTPTHKRATQGEQYKGDYSAYGMRAAKASSLSSDSVHTPRVLRSVPCVYRGVSRVPDAGGVMLPEARAVSTKGYVE